MTLERGGQHSMKGSALRLAALTLPPVSFFLALWLQNRVPLAYLTRDPAETLGAHTYVGLVSNLGIICWTGATAVALFSAWVLRHQQERWSQWRYFLSLGLLSGLLLADDLFMLHERVLPNRFYLPQTLIPVLYGIPFVACFFRFRKEALNTDVTLLLASGVWIALAVVADVAGDMGETYKSYVLEDGAKFVGIVLWMGYVVHTATTGLADRARERQR